MDFDGRRIEIFIAGDHTNNDGASHQIGRRFLQQVVDNYNSAVAEAPAVIGHTKLSAPPYGWAKELRVSGDKLEARFAEIDPEFEMIVEAGRYKSRSASFYVDAKSAPVCNQRLQSGGHGGPGGARNLAFSVAPPSKLAHRGPHASCVLSFAELTLDIFVLFSLYFRRAHSGPLR